MRASLLTLPVVVVAGLAAALPACSSEVTPGATGGGGSSSATTGSSSHSVTVASSGTGTPDIGQPSDQYPAPHPAPPQVVSAAGPILDAPAVQPVLFASDDATMRASIADFSSKILPTSYFKATTSEYGVGTGTALAPAVVDDVVPGTIDDAAIQTWLAGKLNANDPAFAAPTPNSLYMIYYPANVTITLSDGQGVQKSCQSFGGYHSNLSLDAAHGNMPIAYAVVPRCNNFAGFSGIDAVTSAASHELIEAATDPLPMSQPAFGQPDDAHLYWLFALGGGETGDMCAQNPGVFTTFSELPYVVQRSWSNASAKAGHDPCVPTIPGQVYFNAAPVLPDTINFGGGLSMKGVKIPVGESKTIDVKLFSDGPTNGPFSVEAFDSSMFTGGGQTLALTFDVDQGQNGQTLHLTIEALSATQYKAEVFYLVSSIGAQRNMWIGLVGN
jgi:hypothetical protein